MPRHGFERFSSTQSTEVPWRLGLPFAQTCLKALDKCLKIPRTQTALGFSAASDEMGHAKQTSINARKRSEFFIFVDETGFASWPARSEHLQSPPIQDEFSRRPSGSYWRSRCWPYLLRR